MKRLLILTLLLLGSVLLATTGVLAQARRHPLQSDWVLFSSDSKGYLLSVSSQTFITLPEGSPEWSADGNRIIIDHSYVSSPDPRLLLMRPGSPRPYSIVAGNGSYVAADLRGNGYYFQEVRNDTTHLYRLSNSDSDSVHIAAIPESHATFSIWSVDGRWMLLDAERQTTTVFYRVWVADGRVDVLAEIPATLPTSFQWSPDGQWLSLGAMPSASHSGFDLYSIHPATGTWSNMSQTFNRDLKASVWTANSQWVIYSSGGNVYRVHPDGSALEDLTGFAEYNGTHHISRNSIEDWIYLMSVTPFPARTKLYRMRLDGSEWEQITDDDAGEHNFNGWSPDGRWIYFSSALGRDTTLHRVRPDGSQSTNLTNEATDHRFLTASPAGRHIVTYQRTRGVSETALYLMDLQSRSSLPIGVIAGTRYIAVRWQPTPTEKPWQGWGVAALGMIGMIGALVLMKIASTQTKRASPLLRTRPSPVDVTHS